MGLLVRIPLTGTSVIFPLIGAMAGKSLKRFTVKQRKHDAIKLLAQSRLDSIAILCQGPARLET